MRLTGNGMMYVHICKSWIQLKNRTRGNRGGCRSPQYVEYGTQGAYAGQHAFCEHMEHKLRQNRDSNGKHGEAQIK